jgi:Xaa-Pro aminopeptidase
VRRASAASGCDVTLITSPVDVGYLTGFLGGDSYLVVPPSGRATIVSGRLYEVELDPWKRSFGVHIVRAGSLFAGVCEVLAQAGYRGGRQRVAVQGDHLTIAGARGLAAAARKARLAKGSMVPMDGLVRDIRAVKDDGEIALIAQAAEIQQRALEQVLKVVKPGMSELSICAELEYQMKSLGSSGPAFGTIVSVNANAALPHGRPTEAKATRNGTLLIDWGATFRGYRSDMTRTFAFGRWPTKIAEAYKVVHEAYRAGVRAAKPGVACREVDAAVRRVIEKHGLGEAFNHGTGHGIGLDIHEMPSVSWRAPEDMVLKPGHVITIEPGVYFAGVGGVRIEDDVVITERGSRNLCRLPTDIGWATL